eukprot:403366543
MRRNIKLTTSLNMSTVLDPTTAQSLYDSQPQNLSKQKHEKYQNHSRQRNYSTNVTSSHQKKNNLGQNNNYSQSIDVLIKASKRHDKVKYRHIRKCTTPRKLLKIPKRTRNRKHEHKYKTRFANDKFLAQDQADNQNQSQQSLLTSSVLLTNQRKHSLLNDSVVSTKRQPQTQLKNEKQPLNPISEYKQLLKSQNFVNKDYQNKNQQKMNIQELESLNNNSMQQLLRGNDNSKMQRQSTSQSQSKRSKFVKASTFIEDQLDSKMNQVFNIDDEPDINLDVESFKKRYQIDKKSLLNYNQTSQEAQAYSKQHTMQDQSIQEIKLNFNSNNNNYLDSSLSKVSSPLNHIKSQLRYGNQNKDNQSSHQAMQMKQFHIKPTYNRSNSAALTKNYRQSMRNSEIKSFYIANGDFYNHDHSQLREDLDDSEDIQSLQKDQERRDKLKYQVRLDIQKEFERHQVALQSLQSIREVKYEWDIAFYRIFKQGQKSQNQREELMNQQKSLMLKDEESMYQYKEAYSPNTNKTSYTKSPIQQNQSVLSLYPKDIIVENVSENEDIDLETVLQFQNQKEMTLYFEVADQLTQQLENRDQTRIMDKLEIASRLKQLAKVSRDYLNYLLSKKNQGNCGNCSDQGRNTINGYLFDSLWKNYMILVDDIVSYQEYTTQDRVAKAVKKIQDEQLSQQALIEALEDQIKSQAKSHSQELLEINLKMQRLAQERDNCLQAVQDYRNDIGQLTDFNMREKAIGEMKEAYNQITTLIDETQSERTKQISTLNQFVSMLEIGAKQRVKKDSGVQTDLNLLQLSQSPIITTISDDKLLKLSQNSLQKMLLNHQNRNTVITDYTAEEISKQFNYIMSEKARKDVLDKRQNKFRFINLLDFTCGVTLTNTNSYKSSRKMLQSQLFQLKSLGLYSDMIGYLLGVNETQKLSDGLIDIFLSHRITFIDKIENNQNHQSQMPLNGNGMVDFYKTMEFIKDQFSSNYDIVVNVFANLYRGNQDKCEFAANYHQMQHDLFQQNFYRQPIVEFSHIKLPQGISDQQLKELQLKFNKNYFNQLTFTLLILAQQLEQKNRHLRPLFDLYTNSNFQTTSDGKITVTQFKEILLDNTNGSGLDLYITHNDIEVILQFLDPFDHRQISNDYLIDYSSLLFIIEKQSTKEIVKTAKISSFSYLYALLLSLINFVENVAPLKIQGFIERNCLLNDDDDYEQFIIAMKRIYAQFDSVRISNIQIRYHHFKQQKIQYPLGRAVIEEIENDLLNEVVFNNNAVMQS